MAFRGHDESSTSLNKGNFREMVDWVKSQNEQVRDAFDRGGKNCTMTCGDIQKELATCCAHEVTKVIMEELGDRQFSVLIDESRDISIKEQMAVMLRFLNDKGSVVERFIVLHHVKDTTSESLKSALYGIPDKYTLSISRIRGQGYDGASNMRGEFMYITLIVNTTNASCKRRDALIEAQHQDILNKLESCEISRGRGLHQSSSLTRPGDTRWGSHHTTLLRLDQMWSSVLKVLSMVDEDGRGPSQAAVDVVKARLSTMRESGWNNFFTDVQGFCVAKSIPVSNMDDEIPVRGRSRVEGRTITNLHHYRAEIFYVAIDKICVEMDHRFSEGSNMILDCFSCLDPKNSFSKFDVYKLARLASTLILPVSTASVERAFSTMKITKSKLRNKINMYGSMT
ncbi:uncharacterized protein LOC131596814 [Vicia villosa]|uniref:uncharacterized protein LOC131596814 n=1 Tax=Vicia villosa TaxID=3911 RepID=UPI00273CE9BD|nr:uncharacterized protein LOC131596814 [Vicia villosa]